MLSAVAEFLLQPLAEFVLQVVGYLTARVVVPLFTLGRVYVEPDHRGRFVHPGRGSIRRTGKGRYVMEGELGSLFGLIFWFVVAAGIFLYRKYF